MQGGSRGPIPNKDDDLVGAEGPLGGGLLGGGGSLAGRGVHRHHVHVADQLTIISVAYYSSCLLLVLIFVAARTRCLKYYKL